MSCIINSGYALGCRDNIAGVKEVYIRTFSGTTTYTYDTNGEITGSTAPVASASTYYRVAQRAETASFTPGEGQHNLENGTNFWNQTLELSFTKYQSSVRNLVYSLALAEVEIIVLTQNDQYLLVGENNGANLTASNLGVGKAFGDLNGGVVTFVAKEPKPAVVVSSTYFNQLNIV